MKFHQLKEIIEKYNSGKCTNEEKAFLEDWYLSFEWNNENDSITSEEIAGLHDQLWQGIKMKTDIVLPDDEKNQAPIKRMRGGTRGWWYAAAGIIILIGALAVFQPSKKTAVLSAKTIKTNQKNDIAPGGQKAMLTLSDGAVIILDSTKKGVVTTQGNTKILKTTDGRITYDNIDENTTEVVYNTVSTPRGGEYQVTLPDESTVWLNASSSIKFPTCFSGNERKVEITGEVYFEVAKNKDKPFKVQIVKSAGNQSEVEVLGTHFNIMAYDNEDDIKTTLLEGSVKISNGGRSVMILPGEQALVNNLSQISVKKDVNAEEAVAWKNGKFIFQDAGIKTIMRQLERWYDITTAYDNTIPKEEFVGIISRNVNISQILQMLERTGTVRFTIDGRKIIVK